MSFEEHSVCSVCHKIVCCYCMTKLNYKKEEKCHNSKLCIECYSLSINDSKETNKASVSQRPMILKDRHNVNNVNDLSTAEVLELYEFIATKPVFSSMEIDQKETMFPSCVIDKSSPKSISFSFKKGGTFILSKFFK